MIGMRSWVLVLLALASGVLLLGLVAVAATLVGEPVSNFTRDAVAVADVPWYTGSVSLITCMVWSATACMSFLVAWAVPRARRPMLGLGILTAVLAVDDAMLVHDQIGPGHGVPEFLFGAVYAVIGLGMSWVIFRGGTRTTFTVFLLGGGFLGASLVLDEVLQDISIAAEDSTKLLGVLVWATLPVLFHRAFAPAQQEDREAELVRDPA